MIDPGLLLPKLVCVSSISGFILGDPGSVGPDAAGYFTLVYYRTIGLGIQLSVDLFLGDPWVLMPPGTIDPGLLQLSTAIGLRSALAYEWAENYLVYRG